MSGKKRDVVDPKDRAYINQRIGKMWMLGYGFEAIAQETGLDYDTVRKHGKEYMAELSADVKDPEELRQRLLGMWLYVWGKIGDQLETTPSVQWVKASISALQAALDIGGLRSMRVDVGSSQLMQVLGALGVAVKGASAPAALPPGAEEAIDGECREVKEER